MHVNNFVRQVPESSQNLLMQTRALYNVKNYNSNKNLHSTHSNTRCVTKISTPRLNPT